MGRWKERQPIDADCRRDIDRSPDGLIHGSTPIPDRPPEPKRRGAVPEYGAEWAKICLTCPLDKCALDHSRECARFINEIKKKRKEKKTNARNE